MKNVSAATDNRRRMISARRFENPTGSYDDVESHCLFRKAVRLDLAMKLPARRARMTSSVERRQGMHDGQFRETSAHHRYVDDGAGCSTGTGPRMQVCREGLWLHQDRGTGRGMDVF